MSKNKDKKIALFDFDNVIFKGHSTFELIKAQENDGFIPSGVWSAIEEQLKRYKLKELSYKDAADKMLQIWAEGLKNKSYTDVVTQVQDYFEEHKDSFFSWFADARLLLENYDIYIVTTNYQFIAEEVVKKYLLHGYISSEVEVKNGVLTGRVSKTLAGNKGEVKLLLKDYLHEGSLAVGDSENDIDMLMEVENPICFEPDEKLRKTGVANGWAISDESCISHQLKEIVRK